MMFYITLDDSGQYAVCCMEVAGTSKMVVAANEEQISA